MMDRKLLLLGVLRQHEMHGYGLFDFIERYLASCTDLKKSTAYYLLNQMARDGLIAEEEVADENRQTNRPPRRVYSLTDKGEAEFQHLLRQNLSVYEGANFGSDIGLAFLEHLPPSEAIPLLERRRQHLQAALDTVKAVPPHPGSLQLVVEHQRHHLAAEIDWLHEILEGLHVLAKTHSANP